MKEMETPYNKICVIDTECVKNIYHTDTNIDRHDNYSSHNSHNNTSIEHTANDSLGPLYDRRLNVDGKFVKIHKIHEPLQYFDLYQNYLFQYCNDESSEILENEILTAKKALNCKDSSLDEFFHNLNILYNCFRELALTKIKKYNLDINLLINNCKSDLYCKLLQELKNNQINNNQNILNFIKNPENQFKHGDLIDIENFSGTGLFLIYYDQIDKKFIILPTLGDYGNVLPEPGFNLIKKHGLQYFTNSDIIIYQISNLRDIRLYCKETHEYIKLSFQFPVYFEVTNDLELDIEMDQIIVDGIYMYGYLAKHFI